MIVEALARWWGVKEPLPPAFDVEVIAVVSYGATKEGLSEGERALVANAELMAKRYPDALVAFGAFTFSANPAIERESKERIFPTSAYAGLVASTIEECEKILALFPSEFPVYGVLVVTGECHSRTARLVWNTYLPDARVYITTIPVAAEAHPDNPMKFLRTKWSWLLINIARHIVFRIVGVKRMARCKLRQPT